MVRSAACFIWRGYGETAPQTVEQGDGVQTRERYRIRGMSARFAPGPERSLHDADDLDPFGVPSRHRHCRGQAGCGSEVPLRLTRRLVLAGRKASSE